MNRMLAEWVVTSHKNILASVIIPLNSEVLGVLTSHAVENTHVIMEV